MGFTEDFQSTDLAGGRWGALPGSIITPSLDEGRTDGGWLKVATQAAAGAAAMLYASYAEWQASLSPAIEFRLALANADRCVLEAGLLVGSPSLGGAGVYARHDRGRSQYLLLVVVTAAPASSRIVESTFRLGTEPALVGVQVLGAESVRLLVDGKPVAESRAALPPEAMRVSVGLRTDEAVGKAVYLDRVVC